MTFRIDEKGPLLVKVNKVTNKYNYFINLTAVRVYYYHEENKNDAKSFQDRER